MKTIYVTFKKTRYYDLPIAIPDHWGWDDVNRAMNQRLIHHDDLNDLLAGLDWETGATTDPKWLYDLDSFDLYALTNDPPVYRFPDERAPAHPDQMSLLEGA